MTVFFTIGEGPPELLSPIGECSGWYAGDCVAPMTQDDARRRSRSSLLRRLTRRETSPSGATAQPSVAR